MFKVYTPMEDEKPREELYESTLGATKLVLAFQQNLVKFSFHYQRRPREPFIESTPPNYLQVSLDPTSSNNPPPCSPNLQ